MTRKRAPMTRAEKAMLKLWRSNRTWLRHGPHVLDCQGYYWILRENVRAVKEFRAECALLAKERAKEKK